jgi:hypothetical protein
MLLASLAALARCLAEAEEEATELVVSGAA